MNYCNSLTALLKSISQSTLYTVAIVFFAKCKSNHKTHSFLLPPLPPKNLKWLPTDYRIKTQKSSIWPLKLYKVLPLTLLIALFPLYFQFFRPMGLVPGKPPNLVLPQSLHKNCLL